MATAVQSSNTKRLKVLHVVAEIREQAMAYHEFVAGTADRYDLCVVSLHKAVDRVPAGIKVFEGDGSLPGLLRALRTALAERYDIYHVHFPNVSAPFLLVALWRPAVMRRTIFTFHTSFKDLTLRNRILFFFVLCFFRRIVCCSRSSMLSVPPVLRQLAGGRLTFVRNGVSIDRVDAVRGNVPKSTMALPTLVTACRLVPVKDVPTMLQALRLTGDPDLRLTVVGYGPELDALMRLGARTGIAGRVEFTGAVGRDAVYERMLTSDVFISTSRAEGLPLAVMEAMACGLPVILSDIPPHREIVGDDFPLVEPGDAAGFAKEIARLFALPPARRRAIGEEGRRTVAARFSLDAMFDAYERLYREIAGPEGVGAP